MRARWRAIQADARWPPIHDELKRRGFDFANRTADDPDQLFYAMEPMPWLSSRPRTPAAERFHKSNQVRPSVSPLCPAAAHLPC